MHGGHMHWGRAPSTAPIHLRNMSAIAMVHVLCVVCDSKLLAEHTVKVGKRGKR